MKKIVYLSLILFIGLKSEKAHSQFDESQLGAWYMYFWSTTFNDSPWGLQGDLQYRNWNVIGDLEQLLLRGGLTYSPKNAKVKFTLGYGNVQTGVFGSDDATSSESRIYQEALFPQKIGKRFYLNHRARFEQRFVEGQDFRTRYRYNLFLNVPLNNAEMIASTFYIAFYNEIFINAQRDIGNDRTVEIFDRNRTYMALGYALKKNMKLQLGLMRQITDSWKKNQLQLSFHQNWN